MRTSVHDVAAVVGERVRVLRRRKRKWSQYQLAAASGIERSAITRLEAGKGGERGLSLSTLCALADALEVPVARLLLPAAIRPSDPRV